MTQKVQKIELLNSDYTPKEVISPNQKLAAVPMFNYLFLTCNKKSNISKWNYY